MNLSYEIVHLDNGRSFRMLHHTLEASKYSWQYHYHPEFEMVCIPSGTGTRHVGNHLGKYSDGDLIIIGSNLPHSGFGLHSGPLHEEVVIQMKEDFFTKHLITFPEISSVEKIIQNSKFGLRFFGETKQAITGRLLKLSRLSFFDALIELISIFKILSESNEFELLNNDILVTPSLHKNNIRLQNIFNYIERHYNEEITIQKVASLANLSVPAFCNYFKKKINLTFTEFLNQYRIQHACNLLLDEKTIAEISFECGFNNVAYFNKVFKNVLKKTPSEFKKEKLKIA